MSDYTEFLDAARSRMSEGRRLAMATIIETRGSTYRQKGAKLLIDDQGGYVGSVSGGCLEDDLAERAQALFTGGAPFLVPYDLAEDTMWSLGVGCNGFIEVYVEALTEELLSLYEAVPQRHRLDRSVFVEGARLGQWSAVLDGKVVAGEEPTTLPEKTGTVALSEGRLFAERLRPAVQVLVFGSGHDALPMVDLLAETGFYVEVLDPRPAYLTPERFPKAQKLHLWRAGEEPLPPVEEGAYAIVMQHQKVRDTEVLKALLPTNVSYIGLLGPQKRGQDLIRDAGAKPDDARIHSPIGLDIGPESPGEVALSVVTEIVAHTRGREGGRLTGAGRSIHAS